MKTLIYASALAMVLGSGFTFADDTVPQQPPAVQQPAAATQTTNGPANGVIAKDKKDLKQDFKERKEVKAKIRKAKRQLRKDRREARRNKRKEA